MLRTKTRFYLLQGIIISIVALICLLGYAITQSLTVAEDTYNDNLDYVSYEILTDNVMPVSTEEEQTSDEIIRPYTDETVEIGKSYYDYQGEESSQESAIIYYENTYIQNKGVDYVSKNAFPINSIADGTVLSITTDDIVGTTIKIEHNNDMISVYQSVTDVKVKEKDSVTKGQVIATSSTNNIGSDLGNHLHFELYNKNILVNPEDFFTQAEGNWYV